jgi:O-antigen ligase
MVPADTFDRVNVAMPALRYERGNSKLAELCGGHGKWTFLFVWLFGFVLFCRPEDIYEPLGALHLTMVFGMLATALCLRGIILGRAKIAWSPQLKIVLLLTAWFAIGVPFAFYRRGAFELLTGTWLRTLLFFFLLTQTLTSLDRIRKVVWALLLSELIASVLSLLMQGNPLVMVGDRLAGINKGLLGWNFLGITVSVTIPLTAYLYLRRKSVWRTALLLAALGASLWMVVLTASRGGFVGLILSFLLTWWVLLRKSARGRLAVIVAIVFAVLGCTRAPAVFWERLGTIWSSSSQAGGDTSESAAESTRGRLYLLEESLILTARNPIFGLGVNNFPIYTGSQVKGNNAWLGTHNIYSQISSETGILGFILLVVLLRIMLRDTRAIIKQNTLPAQAEIRLLADALFVGTAVFCFQGFFAHLAYEALLYFVAAIIAALAKISREFQPNDGLDATESNSITSPFLTKELPA